MDQQQCLAWTVSCQHMILPASILPVSNSSTNTAWEAQSVSVVKPTVFPVSRVRGLEEPCPLAKAMHRVIGEILDTGKEERQRYARLAKQFWIGDYSVATTWSRTCTQAICSKKSLERLLETACFVRDKYQKELYGQSELKDVNLSRSLDANEAKRLREAWRDDTETWMSGEVQEAYLTIKTKVAYDAERFKELEFKEIFKSLSTSEDFFMVFIRHPFLHDQDRVSTILNALLELLEPAYVRLAEI